MVENSIAAKRESPFNIIEDRARVFSENLDSLNNQIANNASRLFGEPPPANLKEEADVEAPCNEYGRAIYALDQVQKQILILEESLRGLLDKL
jgi:hypothetical protein